MAHHRIATIALTLAVAVGVPATTAAAQQPNKPSSPASANPCSEVCSGGGYALGNGNTTHPAYSLPTILRGEPGPCSEVCSGGSVSQPSWARDDVGARLPHDPRPRSMALSSSYGTAGIPPTVVSATTPGGGFDWGDAGIGAGGMLGLIVIGLGGALALTQRRNHRIRDQRAS